MKAYYFCGIMEETLSNKKPNTKSPEKEMSFWEHLEELRGMMVRSVLAILLLGIIAFINRKLIFDEVILAPNDPHFITNRAFCWVGKLLGIESMCVESVKITIINYSMSGQFMVHMYTSFIAGAIVAVPYIVWEIWRFLKPALRPEESRYAKGAVAFISFLFLTGAAFGYFLITPLTVNFFGSYQVSESVVNQISLSSYISTVVSGTFASGLIFLLPVFVFFLARLGILSPAFLKKTRKYTLVIILLLAAIITPPDVFSQILVSIPLYGLFEFSIWVAGRASRKSAA